MILFVVLMMVMPLMACQESVPNIHVSLGCNFDKSLRREDVLPEDLQKFQRFSLGESLPFDKYFSVTTALYSDDIGNAGAVTVEKNLKKQLPEIIKTDLDKIQDKERRREIRKEYRFPAHVSSSFLHTLTTLSDPSKVKQYPFYRKGDKVLLTISYSFAPPKETIYNNLEPASAQLIGAVSSKKQEQPSRDESMWSIALMVAFFATALSY